MEEKKYLLGTEEQQEWMKEYFFAPRGIGFTEPGTVATDSAEFSAYNVAKSFYQNYPEVFNLDYIAWTRWRRSPATTSPRRAPSSPARAPPP